jgi:hypothetical protein
MMRFWKRAESTDITESEKTTTVAPEIEMLHDVERGYELLPSMTPSKIADLIERLEGWLEMDMLTPSGHILLMEARRQYDAIALRLIALIGPRPSIALLAAPDIRMHGNVDVWGPGGSAFRCGFYPPEEE